MFASRTQPDRDPSTSSYLFGRGTRIALAVGVPISLLLLFDAARGTSLSELTSALAGAKPVPLGLAAAAVAGVYVLQAERWRYIANVYGRMPLRRSVAYVIGGIAISNVVPGRPGEFFRAHWVSRDLDMPWAKGFATVVVDRTSDVLTLAVLLLVTYPSVPHPAWMRDLALVTIVAGAMLVVALLACLWYVARRDSSGKGIPERFRSLWLIRQAAVVMRGAAGVVTTRRAVVIAAFSLAAWAMWAVAAYSVADALSIPFTISEALFVTAVVNLGVAIPSSPGFIGTYQWLCVEALGLFGIPSDRAFAFSVLMHAVWFVPTTLAGFVLLAIAGARRGQHVAASNAG